MVPKTSDSKITDKKGTGDDWDWRNGSVIESTGFNFQHPHVNSQFSSRDPWHQTHKSCTHTNKCMQAKYPYT